MWLVANVSEALGRDPAGAEHRARVVDQHVDARLGRRDLRGHPTRLGHEREIGEVRAVRHPRPTLPQAPERDVGPSPVARDQHDARAHPRERFRGHLADAGGAPGDHHDLVLHRSCLPSRWTGCKR